MSETYFVLFVIAIVLVSWILVNTRSVEGMALQAPVEVPQTCPVRQDVPLPPPSSLQPAWQEDDDVMDSTKMASKFPPPPAYKMDLTFPEAEGPPQPYLTDFSKFHR